MRPAILGFAALLSLTSLGIGAALTTEAQIRHTIIGNTISGVEDGKSYSEYYQPDGYIHGLEPEGLYVGERRTTGRNLSCDTSIKERALIGKRWAPAR